MRAACPTPVSVVEENTGHPRMVRGIQSPLCHTRNRVSKGFACRQASIHDTTTRQGGLSPSTNLRGTTIFKKRTHRELISFFASPRTPTSSPRLGETSMSLAREYMYPSPLSEGTLTESEGEWGEGEEEGYHCLNVTGRNPVHSDSNVTDWKQPMLLERPTKAVSAEHQTQTTSPPLRRSRKVVPIRSLNIGGLGLPYPTEQQPPKGKDYKPGRIVNKSFDCFRCENRMSAHYAHEWFESILTASKVRGARKVETVKERKKPIGRKYSKDEISRALFPRYWSKECMSPDPRSRSRTPDTRPMTQTPDTISGPWRADNSRAGSMDGMAFTREDLRGFCGGHERMKCQPGSKHDAPLAPCRQYYSDTQIGVNVIACGDIWCHDADVRTDSCPPGRVDLENRENEYVGRDLSRVSHHSKTSHLSVHSREGQRAASSAIEFRMRFHCDTSDDVFYELHEEDNNHYHDDSPGMATVQIACSLISNDIRELGGSQCNCAADPQQQDEEHFVDNGRTCCPTTNTSASCCCSQTSNSYDVLEGRCSPERRPSNLKCYSVTNANLSISRSSTRSVSKGDVRPSTFKSQIDCNTSAADQFPTLEVKGKKAATGFIAKGVRRSICRDIKQKYHTDISKDELALNASLEVETHRVDVPTETFYEEEGYESYNQIDSYNPDRREIDLQFYDEDEEDEEEENEEEEEENEEEEEEQIREEEHDANFFRKICEGRLSRNMQEQTYPDLPKPLGRYFCYVPIVDKRYNRWKRRKPKKRKRAQMKIRQHTMKTSSSTSDESAATDGRESKRSKPSRKHAPKSTGRKSRQISRNESRGPTPRELPKDEEQEHSESMTELEFEPVFDQSDWAEDTQFPESTEANTDSSKSSLTSNGTQASIDPKTFESFVSPSPITLVDIQDLGQECSSLPLVDEVRKTPDKTLTPEQITSQTRARSRVASIPSKNCPRTQKSLLSLSLRGPSVEKELKSTDPMKALPRAGGRLPLLRTQRSVLARSSDNMLTCVPSDASYVSGVERRLGWIKRGIMQKTSNQSIIPLPRTDLRLAAEKYTITGSPKTAFPKTRMTNKGYTKSRSGIPRHAKTSTAEKFSPIIRGQKKTGSSKRRREARKSTVFLAYEEDSDDYPTFTLKDLLSTLPDSDSSNHSVHQTDSQRSKRGNSPTKLTNFFNNFVKGSPLHKRKTLRPKMERSISALSFTPAFTFSVYTLPNVYRSHNVSLNGSSK